MKLLFKQRLFSWFDSYDIYDEAGNTVYVVKGQLSWGHKSLRKESKVVQTKKQYGDFSLTALSFASISIFSG